MTELSCVEITDDLRAAWRSEHNLRVHGFLQGDVAHGVLKALCEVPHTLVPPTGMQFQMAMHENYPDDECEHFLCIFTRWWYTEGLRWVMDLTGLELVPPDNVTLVSTLHGKGGYLDPHNDRAPGRRIAYVIGFTEQSWPWQEGGHLEFLRFIDGDVQVTERRPPGFNTIDLFDVLNDCVNHRIPIITEHHERRVIVGWFHTPAHLLPEPAPLSQSPAQAG